jgi:hypothetical protein
MRPPKRGREAQGFVNPVGWRGRACPIETCQAKPGAACGRWRVSRYQDGEIREWVPRQAPHRERRPGARLTASP